MSKKKALKQKKAPKPSKRGQRNVVVVISMLLCLIFAGSILAQWRGMHVANRMNAMLVTTPTVPGPGSPSKEYIYAGGRLLATEEPTNDSQPPVGAHINLALSSNGGTATASSYFNSVNYPAGAANNGDRKGLNNGAGGVWTDDSCNGYPDWLQVEFSGDKTIGEIDLFTIQDSYSSPVEPTEAMTFNNYGLVSFDVQYWTGSAWAQVPGVNVTANNKVWRKFTFASITTSKIKVQINSTGDGWSRVVELEAWGPAPAPPLTNVALASTGAVATASSLNSTYPPGAVINGDRKGLNNGAGGVWTDDSCTIYPDPVEVAFSGTKTISEIDVFTIQDNYWAPTDPTESMTFAYYGLTAFEVQYWTGSAWAQVPGVNVTANNKVWRKFTFSPISTTKIKVLCKGALDGWSRVVELEAWGN